MSVKRVIQLDDLDLFGNDAAEDEAEDVFMRYALRRAEVDTFADATRPICIVRAYKGEGKSALLRLTYATLREREKAEPFVVTRTASAIMPRVDGEDLQVWVRAWKAALFSAIAVEIGRRIGVAFTDDAMSLVEESEKQGFRERNFVSSILDRLKGGARVPDVVKRGAPDAEGAVRRWAEGKEPIWIILDDVDQDFQNTRHSRVRVAAFFVACRELVNAVSTLRVRAAVRPNIWTLLKLEHEALSHVEQYMTDLTWSEEGARGLLARRVQGYLERKDAWDHVKHALPAKREVAEKVLIGSVFEERMVWGDKERPPHVVLFTLSKRRPRWMIELSKIAARQAKARGAEKISRDDITRDLGAFGRRRIEDTVAEFRAQCQEIHEILSAFTREREEMSTQDLLDVIQKKVLPHVAVRIAGITGTPRAMEVAHLLFQVGFVYARRNLQGDEYEHFTFAERPSLLQSRAEVDAGLRWEVHPVYRQALEMRDSEGREVRRRRDGR